MYTIFSCIGCLWLKCNSKGISEFSDLDKVPWWCGCVFVSDWTKNSEDCPQHLKMLKSQNVLNGNGYFLKSLQKSDRAMSIARSRW